MHFRFPLVALFLLSTALVFAQEATLPGPVRLPVRTANVTPLTPGRIVPATPVPVNTSSQGTPADIELKDGTHLTGSIVSEGPISGVTALGPVDVPLSLIRGIAWPKDDARQATLILTNDDSLTVTINAPHLPIKTEWGTANVKLSHIQSMNFSIGRLKWIEGPNGRPALVAAEHSVSSAELNR